MTVRLVCYHFISPKYLSCHAYGYGSLGELQPNCTDSEIMLSQSLGYAVRFRHFDGTLPPYLSSSLCTYQPSRSLHSLTERLLKIAKTNLKTFGERSFDYTAPTVWNSLPANLRASPSLPTFKKCISSAKPSD